MDVLASIWSILPDEKLLQKCLHHLQVLICQEPVFFFFKVKMLGFLNGIKEKSNKHSKYPLQANIRMQTRSQMHAFECNTPQARGSWNSVSSGLAWFT